MARVSFGCYTIAEEIDLLVDMLHRIARGDYTGEYEVDRNSGEYTPAAYEDTLTASRRLSRVGVASLEIGDRLYIHPLIEIQLPRLHDPQFPV